jgi:hypothetical protein
MPVRAIFALLLLVLAGAIVWASLNASLGASVARTLADPWGVVMLIDLYAGFVVAIALYALFERRSIVVLLAAATFVLGNVVTLGWLLWRGWSMLAARASR